ncbi:DUF6319 family protein [Goodfellowiella coeruleoviolacea]|uniref:Translation initiation factor n=1 Tax=Goodfellowiella coeruleoviolacea TaxID=334858 RepID=A0AAE3GHU5_9PSEU|nr:DUF6319 family protein [Goodfellowiella coeruleoviolacea]MCP2166408.1 hypothetical protein [Goodfellowiella coeruleoviolacea]
MTQEQPPRRSSAALSAADLDHLRAELAEGRTPTVWFTAKAVGMEAGRSAKVLGFTEPAEGDFIQVRPTGSQDELSFSPAEMTLTKPPRKPKAPAKPAAPVVAEPWIPPAPPEPVSKPRADAAGPTESAGKRPARAGSGARRVAKPSEVTVTLSSTADGEWTVDVVTGKKRTVRSAPVPASHVAQAAKVLHPDVAEAIQAVLDAAREQQLARVEQLRAELEAAQRALEELPS